MGETASEYMHLVVNTIIFCSAISMLFLLLTGLKTTNKYQIDSQTSKASVIMDDVNGYSDELIYVTGSEVFSDILSSKENIAVFLDGSQLDVEYLRFLKEDNKEYIYDLKTRLNMDDKYLISYDYYSNNEIKAVRYSRS